MADTPRFAVLMDLAVSDFQAEPKKGIQRYARDAGIDVVYFGVGTLSPDDPDDSRRELFLPMIGADEFDGLIVVSATLADKPGAAGLAERLAGYGLPFVSIGPPLAGEPAFAVDNRNGIQAVMDHLIGAHRYRRFAFVSGPLSNLDAKIRLDGYREALTAAGLECDEAFVYEGDYMPQSGFAAVGHFYKQRGLMPQAIVCSNDLMAIGVWNGLMARGIMVPHEVAVTGFDDMQVKHTLSNQFTTVRQPFDELGYQAARRLHGLVRGETAQPVQSLPVQLHLRTSCGCLHLEQRHQTKPAFRLYGALDAVKGQFLAFVNAGLPREREDEIHRFWLETVRDSLAKGNPVYELEETLRDIRVATLSLERQADADRFLMSLYSAMLEECGQYLFLDHWKDVAFSMKLRQAIDRLHDELSQSRSIEQCYAIFRQIADSCQARNFGLVLFEGGEPNGGARAVYVDFAGQPSAWRPGPSHWFPRCGASLVANILNHGRQAIGYLLVDAAVEPDDVFDLLRVRLNSIFRDFQLFNQVWELNAEMSAEIAARKSAEKRLREALAMVERLSIEDELTGLRNRRGFLSLAEQQIKYLRREKQGFFVIYADLNGLKKINDQHGHKDGDLAIATAARALRASLRDSDIIGRMGGDEFTVLASNVTANDYKRIKDRILSNCRRLGAALERPWVLSMSIGHYFSDIGSQLDIDAMLEQADEELYREKQNRDD